MTVEWNRTVTEVVWESQTAPGITWTTVVGGTSSGGGVTVHNDLSGRSAADAHPMSAITDLEPALTDIATAVQAQQGDIGTLQTAVAGKQASDADLTAIAALAPSDDALIQRKAGAWTSRTPAQVKADMSIGVGDVSGLDENTRDVIGTALVAGSGVAVTVDDPGNTITIAVSGVVADAINDGTTTVAPSQNAVFDALALTAPLASPTFTGTPAAPTAAQGTNTTQVATTAYVQTETATKLSTTGGGKDTVSNLGSLTGTVGIDLANGNSFYGTLTANTTFTFTGATNAKECEFFLSVTQDSTPRSITWPTIKWPAATAPTISTASGAVDHFVFRTRDGGTTWYGYFIGKGMA